ncbi:MAG: LutC/YkgG family protein [Cytophaga sp.]|uniref:LutC/YkgG family protein n=1 Tax=Cytophaga sp. TaxID=29535 RepID=UPI003F8019EF
MALNPSKEAILKRIRQGLTRRNTLPPEPNFTADIYTKSEEEDLSVVFAHQFLHHKGEFYFVENETELCAEISKVASIKGFKNIFVWEKALIDMLSPSALSFETSEKNFTEAGVGITTCNALIARTGSVLISSSELSGRRLSIYPHVHVVIAKTSQLVYDIKDGLEKMKAQYGSNLPSMICLETGPSRTADIEKTLVLGAHGPKELLVFLIDDSSN